MEKRSFVEDADENAKSLFTKIMKDKISENYKKGTESLVEISKNLTGNLVKNVQDKSSEVISSIKNMKLRNLEAMMRVDKSDLLASNKKSLVYQSAETIVIIDRDMWGEPQTVTVKTGRDITIKAVKYAEDTPFLYPVFNEKNLNGQIIHLDENSIWYFDGTTVSVVTFKSDKMEVAKVNISVPPNFTRNELLKMPELFSYIQNCVLAFTDKRLTEFLNTMKINVENLFRLAEHYIIVKTPDREFDVFLLQDGFTVYDQIHIPKLPFINTNGLDVLFSNEIVSFIQSNNYRFEDFSVSENYLEYWRLLGDKKVCLMRCRL